ncbi:hypothetical protein ACH5RR_037285 [Cinchona calisaya]|uniref:Protein kinase domain-containing protein n=1 Tax=Cinchona calisaya TaxID=153742 RepID=A0ABD2Y5P9_9GENT
MGKLEDYLGSVSYQRLHEYTAGFSEDNFIVDFQFGKIYRGIIDFVRIKEHMVVKVWENKDNSNEVQAQNEQLMMDEIFLLQHERMTSQGCMVNLKGYCHEDNHLAVIYDLESSDTLHNHLPAGDFTWLHRMKVALQLAHLLKFLHVQHPPHKPLHIRNLCAANIMLDKDYNPKLFDFSMVCGLIFSSNRQFYPQQASSVLGKCAQKTDVFAFGMLLLSLMMKRAVSVEDLKFSAKNNLDCDENDESNEILQATKRLKYSLVHESFGLQSYFCASDGPEITQLAIECVQPPANGQLSMKDVVKRLWELEIVQKHDLRDMLKEK